MRLSNVILRFLAEISIIQKEKIFVFLKSKALSPKRDQGTKSTNERKNFARADSAIRFPAFIDKSSRYICFLSDDCKDSKFISPKF